MSERTHMRQWRRLVSRLLRARADPAPSPSADFVPTRCFGPLGDPEQVALEGLIAASGQAPEPDSPS